MANFVSNLVRDIATIIPLWQFLDHYDTGRVVINDNVGGGFELNDKVKEYGIYSEKDFRLSGLKEQLQGLASEQFPNDVCVATLYIEGEFRLFGASDYPTRIYLFNAEFISKGVRIDDGAGNELYGFQVPKDAAVVYDFEMKRDYGESLLDLKRAEKLSEAYLSEIRDGKFICDDFEEPNYCVAGFEPSGNIEADVDFYLYMHFPRRSSYQFFRFKPGWTTKIEVLPMSLAHREIF